jgi:hypothetical protein
MRNIAFTITVPPLFSPLSVFCAESRSYIITSRFNFRETLQINQFDSQISNNAFVLGLYCTPISKQE